MMLDIVLIFMLVCHVYCYRDNEQFMVCVDVNYTFVNFVKGCVILKNQNTDVFLMCYSKCNYYFGHCAYPGMFYVYMYRSSVLVSGPVCVVWNTF